MYCASIRKRAFDSRLPRLTSYYTAVDSGTKTSYLSGDARLLGRLLGRLLLHRLLHRLLGRRLSSA